MTCRRGPRSRRLLAEEDRDSAIEAAQADKAAAVEAANTRATQAETRAREGDRAGAGRGLVRAASDARDQVLAQTAQAEQRAAAAEARAEDSRAETARVREDATREAGQLRADAERERDEILARLTDTAGRLDEVTRTHAADLERLRAELERIRQEAGTASAPKRRRAGQGASGGVARNRTPARAGNGPGGVSRVRVLARPRPRLRRPVRPAR